MSISTTFSFKNPFPRLADLTEKASDWLSRKSAHQVLFQKWRSALDTAPAMDTPVNAASMDKAARSFSTAFAAYDRPNKPQEMSKLGLSDLNNALYLSKAWENTMQVAG